MADGVDAAVDWMQAAAIEAVIYGAPTEAEGRELAPRHDAVLAPCERRDRAVHPTTPHFAPYDVVNCGRVAHWAMVTG